jgi:hypothetical protein
MMMNQNLNIDVLFSTCALRGDFWVKHLLTVLLPMFVLSILLLIAIIVQQYRKRENPHYWDKRLFPNPFERAIFLFGSGLSPLYTYIISVAMAPFRCFEQFDGSYSLVPSPNLDCYDDQWRSHWIAITIGLL